LNQEEGLSGSGVLGRLLPDCAVYYSNLHRGAAGVAIAVRKEILSEFSVSVVPLEDCLRGYVLGLSFTPLTPTSTAFCVFNCYLDSGGFPAKTKQLQALLKVPAPAYSYFAGDWNFSLTEEDSSAVDFIHPPANFLGIWSDFVDHFSLKEVGQPLHTYYHICSRLEDSCTRRLDRVYLSHSEMDLSLTPVQASYASTPHNILKKVVGTPSSFSVGELHQLWSKGGDPPVSDHIPISIRFLKGKKKFNSPRIPVWMASDPRYSRILLDLLASRIRLSDTPFAQHEAFVKAAFKARALFMREKAEVNKANISRLTQFNICLRAIRLLCVAVPNS
jgi:hypothetical protein